MRSHVAPAGPPRDVVAALEPRAAELQKAAGALIAERLRVVTGHP